MAFDFKKEFKELVTAFATHPKIQEAIKNDKSLKPIPNKAAKTKDSVYKTVIYDAVN